MNVYAAYDWSNPAANPLAKFSTLSGLINVFLPLLIFGAALVLLAMLLWGSYTWLTAGGNSENVAKAQKIMTYAIVGLVLVILSFIFVKLIKYMFNIQVPI